MHQGLLFLIALGSIWILFATVQDFKKREIANWLNFSLIIFAMGARFFYSLFFNDGFNFFLQGVVGLGIFFIFGNLLYSLRIFAGGDAKLMISLGAILPFSSDFLVNIKIYVLFFCIFFIIGAIYGLISSFVLVSRNFDKFRKEFSKQFKLHKKFYSLFLTLGLFVVFLGFFEKLILYFGLLIFFFPLLYTYAKAIEEGIMILELGVSKLAEGDWLYKDLKVGKKIIKAKWDGLSKQEIREIRKRFKKVKIKQGIPFVPVFLISFIILVLLFFYFPFQNYGILLGSHIFPLGFSILSIF